MRIFTATVILLLMIVPIAAAQGEVAEDTLYVTGKAVVFFGPTEQEYDSLPPEEKAQIDEVLSDFYYYRENVIPFLKSNQIQEFLTAKSKIQVQLSDDQHLTFAKENFDHVVGLIMTDGKEDPEVFLGIATDMDLIDIFKDYFGLK